MTKKIHFKSLHEYHDFFDLPQPEHPLISISKIETDNMDESKCPDIDLELSMDFYSINLKNIISGELHYGRSKYDFSNGSLICMAPRQIVKTKGIRTRSTSRFILIHEDFLRGTTIQNALENANYFSYAVNEALHLSPKEETLVETIFDTLELEYQNNHDAFSKEIMISQLKTLLTYGERFYRRQFQQRMENLPSTVYERFISTIKKTPSDRIPNAESIAKELNMTPRYLSDALKVETGKTSMENIHEYQLDQAKNLLLGTDDSVSTIAYSLGFDYPQYFSRLFKNKIGMTPTEYRGKTKH